MTIYQRDWLPSLSAFGSVSADQVFRNWVTDISNGMVAVGLVQTADTGQINKATVTSPAGFNSLVRGYEMYRFTDALQATSPVFIKIEYASNAFGTGAGLFVTVGKATDGAGSLSNLVSTRLNWQAASTNPTSHSPLLMSSDGSSLGLMSTRANPGTTPDVSIQFFIERSRNADGTPNGDGVLYCGSGIVSNGSLATTQFLSYTNNSLSTAQANYPIPFPAARTATGNSGTSVTLVPAMVVTPKAQGQSLLLLGTGVNDFVRGTLVQAVVGEALRTYIVMNGSNNPAKSLDGSIITTLMRWE